jgi:hypothetical protein
VLRLSGKYRTSMNMMKKTVKSERNMRIKRHWICILLTITVSLIAGQYIIGMFSNLYCGECGKSLPAKIRYRISSPYTQVPPLFPNPTIRMLSILSYKDKSTILVRFEKPIKEKNINQYISNDRGETWHIVDWKLGFENLRHWEGTERMMSRIDHRVIYDCYFKCKNGFDRSTNGGKSWVHIEPFMLGGSAIDEILLLDTGIHAVSRLYAKVWINNEKEARFAVSNDYGSSFELLPTKIQRIVESRANESVWYGEMRNINGLFVSKDEGKNWELMDGSKEFWQPLYTNSRKEEIRSWKRYPDDKEWPPAEAIIQIESDPTHWDWIYILTFKGLYISRDAGKSFRLSSLAQGWVKSIDRIAVDPLDGRYLYAVVDLGKFYRSSDYGCSWVQMKELLFLQ